VLNGERSAAKGGRCVTAEGRLADSAPDMAATVHNCVREVGILLDEALRMASTYPADMLGLSHHWGQIAQGYRGADLDRRRLAANTPRQKNWRGLAVATPITDPEDRLRRAGMPEEQARAIAAAALTGGSSGWRRASGCTRPRC
jgi:hypothetical protein